MSIWHIYGGNRLTGSTRVQGAKNAVLPIMAASVLAGSETVLHNVPDLKDVTITLRILRHLGCTAERDGDTVRIDSRGMNRDFIPHDLMRELRSSVIFLGAILTRFGTASLSMPGGCELGPRPVNLHLDALRAAVGPDTAGLMLTNPNTVGIFDKNILEITKIIHDAGGLCYYDGANLNAVMGVVRPGDMGFDCIHSNLHKTFATPHGGGGPGAGAVGCKEFLKKYMPGPLVVEKDGKYGFAYPEKSIGRVKMFYGNFDVVVRALTYVLTLGKSGIREAAMNAVLNANYMRVRLKDTFTMAYDEICMHEFVMSLVDLHKETGVSALDLAKGMLDFGLHPPTMYFPLIVHEALMIEPCETESKETMDEVCGIYCKLFELAHSDPETLHTAPHSTPVRRLDEVGAARNMVLRYQFA